MPLPAQSSDEEGQQALLGGGGHDLCGGGNKADWTIGRRQYSVFGVEEPVPSPAEASDVRRGVVWRRRDAARPRMPWDQRVVGCVSSAFKSLECTLELSLTHILVGYRLLLSKRWLIYLYGGVLFLGLFWGVSGLWFMHDVRTLQDPDWLQIDIGRLAVRRSRRLDSPRLTPLCCPSKVLKCGFHGTVGVYLQQKQAELGSVHVQPRMASTLPAASQLYADPSTKQLHGMQISLPVIYLQSPHCDFMIFSHSFVLKTHCPPP